MSLRIKHKRQITLIFDIFRIGVVPGYQGGMLNLCSVYSASYVRRLCALLCPAISFLHFHVLHFHVRHFHVLQCHALQIGPSISRPSFSRPAFSAPPKFFGFGLIFANALACIVLWIIAFVAFILNLMILIISNGSRWYLLNDLDQRDLPPRQTTVSGFFCASFIYTLRDNKHHAINVGQITAKRPAALRCLMMWLYRLYLDAAVHRVHPVWEDVAVRRDTLWSVAVTRLHRLPLLHLHRLLHHRRPILFHPHAGTIPRLAHQTQDM